MVSSVTRCLRVVEEDAGALGGQPSGPARVLGEQVAQVAVAQRGVVGQHGMPLGGPVEGGRVVVSSALMRPS